MQEWKEVEEDELTTIRRVKVKPSELEVIGSGLERNVFSESYKVYSGFIRHSMQIGGVAVLMFIYIQYIVLTWIVIKKINLVDSNAVIVLTTYIGATFGETIIIAKVMTASIFSNSHQENLANYMNENK